MDDNRPLHWLGELQVEVAGSRTQDRIEKLGAEALAKALARPAAQRPEDAAALVRVLQSLEPLGDDPPRRPSPGFGSAADFWG